jgi:formate-dependent phosphoribosylglycinamide formyltransferase (GAR transformylase)
VNEPASRSRIDHCVSATSADSRVFLSAFLIEWLDNSVRMGVALARAGGVGQARALAAEAARQVRIVYSE